MAPLSYSSSFKKRNEKKFCKLLAELVDTERTYIADLEGVNIDQLNRLTPSNVQLCGDYAPLKGKYKSRQLLTNERRKLKKVRRAGSLVTFNPFIKNCVIMKQDGEVCLIREVTEEE